jgi:hypothetical protein
MSRDTAGMNRKSFLTTMGAVVFSVPLAAWAQQSARVYRVGLFHVGVDHVPPSLDGLRDGLKALGYEEGLTSLNRAGG